MNDKNYQNESGRMLVISFCLFVDKFMLIANAEIIV